jgi:putative oxidoreductase
MLTGLGVPMPDATAWLVGGVEVAGGIALLLGLLVRPAALVLLADMIVALVLVHLPAGFSFIHITGSTANGPTFGMPGYEAPFLFIAGLLAILIHGAGAASFDAAMTERALRHHSE